MFIILDDNQVNSMREKYTVLEVDTFRIGTDGPVLKAYAVIENIPLPDLPMIENWTNLHNSLLTEYRKRNWEFCEQAIENLVGTFGGEMDSFYAELQTRILNYKDNDPGPTWDYIIEKTAPEKS
jgi:hypothetical protein